MEELVLAFITAMNLNVDCICSQQKQIKTPPKPKCINYVLDKKILYNDVLFDEYYVNTTCGMFEVNKTQYDNAKVGVPLDDILYIGDEFKTPLEQIKVNPIEVKQIEEFDVKSIVK